MTRDRFRPADHPNETFIMTTVVGSYPKPRWLHDARTRRDDDTVDFGEAEYREAVRDASRVIVEAHERAGLDVVVDGEMGRTEMVEHVARHIDGFEFHGPVKVWGHNYIEKPSVVDAVAYREPWHVEEFTFADEVATRPVKVPLTGPYTLARWSFNEHYEGTAELAVALADLVNVEVRNLVEAGARYVQIDEPAFAAAPEDHELVGECLDRLTAGLPDDVRVGLHVCYGDYGRLYPEVLEFPIDEFDVELASDGFAQLDVFTEHPFDLDLGIGVVDAHDTEVERVDEIVEHVTRGLDVVSPDRLTVSPDCGLKLLPRDVAFRKLSNMVTAVRRVETAIDSGDIDVPKYIPTAD